ncbi:MAG: PRC-barrel domain-containing protein [Gemmatimonadaceae bacterium]
MERNDRDGRDAAGVGPYAQERELLAAMSTLKSWTVSAGEPDIRGWDVRTVTGRQLGTVSDLLVDREKGEVVLLDVDLPGTDRHTFVPIRIVQIDRATRNVVMDSADLPESGLARDEPQTAPESTPGGIVRYPMADRQSTDEPIERRQAERRRIDRVSTDF